jgi:hypothetical protein
MIPQTTKPLNPKRIAGWFLTNGGLAFLLWAAIAHDSVGAARVFCFAIWFFAVLTVLGAFDESLRNEIRAKGRAMPRLPCILTGYAFVAFLVWHGWWATAAGMLICECFTQYIFDAKEKGGEA